MRDPSEAIILEIEDKLYLLDTNTYQKFLEKNPPRTMISKLNTLIANTEQRTEQLSRIEENFTGHIQRQVVLERLIMQSLKELTYGH